MIKTKRTILALSVILSLIFILTFVSATDTLTINSPVQYGNYSTTMNVSITNNYVNATINSYNVTLYCNKSGGAVDTRTGSDISKIVTISNSSEKVSNFESAAVSISSLSDILALYNCSAYADNLTTQVWSTAKRYITVDNTVPTCTVSVPNANIPSNGWQTVTWSVTDALLLLNNYENVSGPTGYTTTTYSTAVVATQTINAQALTGNWRSSVNGSDTAGNTCTATTTWTSYSNQGGSSGGGGPSVPITTQQTALPSGQPAAGGQFPWLWVGIGAGIFIILIIVVVAVSSGKSRRRRRRR